MLAKYVIEVYDVLDDPRVGGEVIKKYLLSKGAEENWIEVHTCCGAQGSTDFVCLRVPGREGKSIGGRAASLGVIGRLGGIGARPELTGFVSDGDGALACLTAAAKAVDMFKKGDRFPGDLIFSTHICPNAPTLPHEPVAFMDSPVDMEMMNQWEVKEEMDAILSIDTTKGNRILNHNGIAISPTIKEGYILRVSEVLLDVFQIVCGRTPAVFALSQQDITPYGNNLYHLNSILQPSTASSAPVVGVAIATESIVPGCATGATHLLTVEEAARFALEVAKIFNCRENVFFDKKEFELLQTLYGSMKKFQKRGEIK